MTKKASGKSACVWTRNGSKRKSLRRRKMGGECQWRTHGRERESAAPEEEELLYLTFVFRVQHAKQSKTNEWPIRLFSFTGTWEVTLIKNKSNSDRPALSFIVAAHDSFSSSSSSSSQSRIGQSNDVLDNTLIQQKCNIIYIGEGEEEKNWKKSFFINQASAKRERESDERQGKRENARNRTGIEKTRFFIGLKMSPLTSAENGFSSFNTLFFSSESSLPDDDPLHSVSTKSSLIHQHIWWLRSDCDLSGADRTKDLQLRSSPEMKNNFRESDSLDRSSRRGKSWAVAILGAERRHRMSCDWMRLDQLTEERESEKGNKE